jgi:membrane-bound serine protease (ClpP class)
MSWPLIIIVLLIGLALVALEIVALPGGVSGVLGGVLVIIGVWQSYAQYGSTAGNIALIASIVIGIAMLAFLMKSGTWKRFSLKEESDGKTNQPEKQNIKVGAQGKSLTRLAPAGNAVIDGEIVEVHSDGEFLDEGTPIEVTEIEGYKITVRKC